MFDGFDKYIIVFLTGFVVTYLLTPGVRLLALRCGAVDLPNERRPHKRPTPRGGGLAVVLGIYAACLLALSFPGSGLPGGGDLHWWMMFLPASLILLVVGVVDDLRGLSAGKKLAGQVVAALWIALSGTHFGSLFGYQMPPLLDGFLVVVWIVAIINAYNLIDGLDGLASGLAVISATGLCGILILGHGSGVVLPLVALIGASLAFLRYNFHPATIFLGDTGSMSIGFILGVVSLQTFTKNTFFLSMTIPLLILGVPIYDALLAIWRRSVRRLVLGSNPGSEKRGGIMTADVEHLHHRLVKAGLSTRRVAVTLCVTNAVLVVLGMLLATFQSHAYGIFLLALLAFAYVLLRHMAVIELRETGRVLLTGLRRPAHSLPKALAYPLWDAFCLAGALGIAMRLFEPSHDRFWHSWFVALPTWVTPTLCLLAVSRTYLTVWTRVRFFDVLVLLFILEAGLFVSLAIALLMAPGAASMCFLRALVIIAFGHGAMILVRVFYHCLEEGVLHLRSTSDGGGAGPERVVLYGAGGRCQLYLKERGFHNSSSFDHRVITGLIDDEPNLHFRWVYGHMVLGGGRDLPQLIPQYQIRAIVITAALRPESLLYVRELASQHGLCLSEWCFETQMVHVPATPSMQP